MDIQIAKGFMASSVIAGVHMEELGINLWVYLVDESPSVLSLVRICDEV